MIIVFERREQGAVQRIDTLHEALQLSAGEQTVFWRAPGASDATAQWSELSAEWIAPLQYLLAQPLTS